MTVVVAVVNTKGGTGKTTTVAYAAHALHEQGRRVAVVDADPQGSAVSWSRYAGGWPFPVITDLDKPDLHRRLPGVVGTDYDVLLIDTPPLDQLKGVVVSALIAATVVLVPVAPTPAEVERMRAVREAITRSGDLRVSGLPPRSAVLLSRTVAGAASTAAWREQLEAAGDWVLRVQVARLERFAQAFGGPIERASTTGYGDAINELLEGAQR